MVKEDIRRYSLDELKDMNDRRDFVPTPSDAPAFEGDDDFWAMVERGLSHSAADVVELRLSQEALEYFKKSGPDYLERMAHILEDQARKAS